MAQVQKSGPIIDINYDPDQFQTGHADEAGIVNDYDGSAFRLVLPGSGTEALIGSTTQDSVAHVGGYPIFIGRGTSQSVDIPVSTNSAVGRNDLIVARYSAAWLDTLPGPVRIHRIAGTEGSGNPPSPVNNAYGSSGIKDMVLFETNRKLGGQPTLVVDRRPRVGRHLYLRPGAMLPAAPLGYMATRDNIEYVRVLVSGSPDWVEKSRPATRLTGTDATQENHPNWQRHDDCEMVRYGQDGKHRTATLVGRRLSPTATANSNGDFTPDLRVMRLHVTDRPTRDIPVSILIKSATGGNTYGGGGYINTDGWLVLTSTNPNITIGPAGPTDTVRAQVSYYIA